MLGECLLDVGPQVQFFHILGGFLSSNSQLLACTVFFFYHLSMSLSLVSFLYIGHNWTFSFQPVSQSGYFNWYVQTIYTGGNY